MRNFDIKAIESNVDYDLHDDFRLWLHYLDTDYSSHKCAHNLTSNKGTWDSTYPYIGPVANAHTNLTEID